MALSPGRNPAVASDPSIATFAFRIVLASLTMIFGATLVAYAVVRTGSDQWRTPEMPELPLGLVAATVLLVGTSWAFERARAKYRRNEPLQANATLKIAAFCAVGFLLAQTLNWQHMAAPGGSTPTLYPFTFYMLTGTHALHVLGGLVPLGIVIWRGGHGEYSSSRHQGVTLCAQYWHYLGIVWLVVLATLWWGSN